jgi:hypothetical protein
LWTISVMWEITEVYNETKISIYLIPYSYTWFIAIFFFRLLLLIFFPIL